MVSLRYPHTVPMVSLWYPHTVPVVSPCCPHAVPMVSPCCPHGILILSLWSPHAVPLIFPWCPHTIPMLSPWCPHTIPSSSHGDRDVLGKETASVALALLAQGDGIKLDIPWPGSGRRGRDELCPAFSRLGMAQLWGEAAVVGPPKAGRGGGTGSAPRGCSGLDPSLGDAPPPPNPVPTWTLFRLFPPQ